MSEVSERDRRRWVTVAAVLVGLHVLWAASTTISALDVSPYVASACAGFTLAWVTVGLCLVLDRRQPGYGIGTTLAAVQLLLLLRALSSLPPALPFVLAVEVTLLVALRKAFGPEPEVRAA